MISELLLLAEVSREVWSALSQHADQKEQLHDEFPPLPRLGSACLPSERGSEPAELGAAEEQVS